MSQKKKKGGPIKGKKVRPQGKKPEGEKFDRDPVEPLSCSGDRGERTVKEAKRILTRGGGGSKKSTLVSWGRKCDFQGRPKD